MYIEKRLDKASINWLITKDSLTKCSSSKQKFVKQSKAMFIKIFYL